MRHNSCEIYNYKLLIQLYSSLYIFKINIFSNQSLHTNYESSSLITDTHSEIWFCSSSELDRSQQDVEGARNRRIRNGAAAKKVLLFRSKYRQPRSGAIISFVRSSKRRNSRWHASGYSGKSLYFCRNTMPDPVRWSQRRQAQARLSRVSFQIRNIDFFRFYLLLYF